MFRHSKNYHHFFKVCQKIIPSIGISGGLWLAGIGAGGWLLQGTIAPVPVQAATERRTIIINRQFNETYQSMLRRAEAAVRAAAQQIFDRDVSATDISVTALGESGGAIAPILTLEVSRSNWRTSPNPERWANYHSEAQSLLNLSPSRTTATTPATTPTTPVATPTTPASRNRPPAGNQPSIDTSPPGSQPNGTPSNRQTEDEFVIF